MQSRTRKGKILEVENEHFEIITRDHATEETQFKRMLKREKRNEK